MCGGGTGRGGPEPGQGGACAGRRRRRLMADPWRGAEPLWRTPPGRLAPPHIYRMAGALGAELRRVSARFGPEAVAGLVPPVVRLLELLEALVAPVASAEGEAATPAAPAGRQEAEVSEGWRRLSGSCPFGGCLRGCTRKGSPGDSTDPADSFPGVALTWLSPGMALICLSAFLRGCL